MIMLSELLRFEVTDEKQNGAKLTDLAVPLLEADYPNVTQLVFSNQEDQTFRLDWSAVKALDSKHRKIIVEDLAAAEECEPDEIKGDVLLRRDVLDAMILDLLNRRATRANDLQLELEENELRLRA